MSNEIKGTVATKSNLKGTMLPIGKDGDSAYEIALIHGFVGTEEEWLKSLQGESGVYLGSGEMPEDCNVQIDPTGEPLTLQTEEGTIVSQNADFAEVAEWADGNPNNEDRTGYFVCANVPIDGIVMKKATSTDDVKGVSILAPAFAGNYSKDKLDSNGKLLPKYSYVAIIGFVPVRDKGRCTVGGRCMPDDDGCAIPSSNSMGYQVVSRIDDNRVLIIIEPNGDMVQRIKTKVNEILDTHATKEEVDAKIGSFNNTFANIIKANIADTSIVVNDVSPIEHNVGCKLSSKNLCSYTIPKGVINGIYVPLNLPPGTYTFSANVKAELTSNAYLLISRVDNDGTAKSVARPIDAMKYNPTSFTVEPNYNYRFYIYCGVSDYMYNTFDNLQIELGTTATTYTPYVSDVSNIKVVQYKRNLFNPYAYSSLDNATIEDDGSISLGTTEGEVNSSSFNYEISLKKGTYNFKFEKELTDVSYPFYFEVTHNDNFTFPENLDSYSFRFSANDGDVLELYGWCPAPIFDVGNIKIQLEFDTATDYEQPTVYTSLADGTVEGIKSISPNMTLLTNKGVLINCNYNIDTKAYIDNKFAELQALILEG